MRQLSIVLFVFSIIAVRANAQSDSRYGTSSAPPKLPDFATAFDSAPPRPAAGGRYGGGATPPAPAPSALPRSNRTAAPRPSGDRRPTTPRPGGSITSNAVTPIPPRPTANRSQPTQPRATQPRPAQPRSSQPLPTQPRRATPATPRPVTPSRPAALPTQPQSRIQPGRLPTRSTGVTLPETSRLSAPTRSTFAQPSGGSLSTPPPSASQRIMARMLQPRPRSDLRGTPVTVAEVTRGALTRDEQSHRVEAYWDLCASVADYYLGLREEEELQIHKRNAPSMSDAFRLAEQELRGRLDTSLHAAQASQRRLASMMRTSRLPLPGDAPFCGEYQTRFDELSGAGPRYDEARGLHELLPARYGELRRTASSIARAEKLAQTIADRSSGSDGKAMLRALELLALNRRAFVQLAKDYNRRIARYTELTNPGRVDNNLLVAMLVGSSERVSVSTVASLR